MAGPSFTLSDAQFALWMQSQGPTSPALPPTRPPTYAQQAAPPTGPVAVSNDRYTIRMLLTSLRPHIMTEEFALLQALYLTDPTKFAFRGGGHYSGLDEKPHLTLLYDGPVLPHGWKINKAYHVYVKMGINPKNGLSKYIFLYMTNPVQEVIVDFRRPGDDAESQASR